MRKPVFGVSAKASFKPVSSAKEILENRNFTCSKFTYDTLQKAKNKDTDQTVRMRRLICACVVCKTPKTDFLASRPAHIRFTIPSTDYFSCISFCLLTFFKSKFFTKFIQEHHQCVKQFLDPDHDRCSVGANLGSNCLQR